MKFPIFIIFSALLGFNALSTAQTAHAPSLGWITADDPGRIQDVVGVPGAARLSPLRDAGPALRLAALRPGDSRQLAITAEGAVGVIDLSNPGAQEGFLPLLNAVQSPALVTWSPGGRAAFLSTVSGGAAQVWRESGAGLELAWEMLSTAPRAALSDDGSLLLLLEDGLLALYGQDGSATVIRRGFEDSFTFVQARRSFAYVEQGALVVRTPETDIAAFELPELPNGAVRQLLSPAPGRLLVVDSSAETGASGLSLWSEQGEKLGEWSCPCRTAEIRPTGAPGIVQLAAPGDGPLWLADFSGGTPRVFFVPPNVESPAEGGDR